MVFVLDSIIYTHCDAFIEKWAPKYHAVVGDGEFGWSDRCVGESSLTLRQDHTLDCTNMIHFLIPQSTTCVLAK